jgi:RNA-directed DNA polymerase
VSHYRRFSIPKKSGGLRNIAAPMPRLKAAQHWLYETILSKIQLHDAAHGFVHERSIVSNATPHLKAELVINLDLKDFFPTIDFHRVKGMFRALGYSEQLAIIFALLSTEPETDEVEIDGSTYYVARGERHLPQGSPASPVITNIICRRMDARFRGLAKKFGYTYTRYADDLTFSASGEPVKEVKRLLAHVRQIIADEDFKLHPKKLRIMRKGARKEVTGIVVNEKPAIIREEYRRFRSLVFQVEKDGPQGKHWNNSRNLLAAMRGYANFIAMVDPEKGKPLVERVKAICVKHQYKHVIRHPKKTKEEPVVGSRVEAAAAVQGTTLRPEMKDGVEKTKKPWWKFW